LFYNENCQKWVAQQIVTQETEVRKVDARLAEVDFITRVGGRPGPALKAHFPEVQARRDRVRDELLRLESGLDQQPALLAPRDRAEVRDHADLERLRRALQVAEASLNELKWFSDEYTRDPQHPPLDDRRAALAKERSKDTAWLNRYRWAQPR